MKTYEQKVVSSHQDDDKVTTNEFAERLTKLGQEGYRIVHACQDQNDIITVLMEREVVEQKENSLERIKIFTWNDLGNTSSSEFEEEVNKWLSTKRSEDIISRQNGTTNGIFTVLICYRVAVAV